MPQLTVNPNIKLPDIRALINCRTFEPMEDQDDPWTAPCNICARPLLDHRYIFENVPAPTSAQLAQCELIVNRFNRTCMHYPDAAASSPTPGDALST